MTTIADRARSYLAKLPPAISGSGGHQAAFEAALVLAKGFNLRESEALPLMIEWNACCAPPWTIAELKHKLRDAAKATAPTGYLLDGDSHVPAAGVPYDDGAAKARKRSAWPAFTRGTPAELEAVAKLRGLPSLAVRWADHFGILRFCDWRNHRAFVIRPNKSDAYAQARRLDGQPWEMKDGARAKNIALPGSEGSNRWLSATDIGKACPVLMTEGGLGVIEGLAALILAGADASGWVAISSANDKCRLTASMLDRLSGRHVRIVADADDAGRDAAAGWALQLTGAGCRVDAVRLPGGCKDLGDAVKRRDELNFDFGQLFA